MMVNIKEMYITLVTLLTAPYVLWIQGVHEWVKFLTDIMDSCIVHSHIVSNHPTNQELVILVNRSE